MIKNIRFGRAIAAGVVGSIGREALSLVQGQWVGIFFNPKYQSPDFLQVLTHMHVTPAHLVVMHFVLSVIHGLAFALLAPCLGSTKWRRGITFGVLLWAFGDLYFDLLVPWTWFHEPTFLMLLDLLAFWIPVTLTEGMLISFVYGYERPSDPLVVP